MISDKILQYITDGESEREYGNPLRMSNAGSCQRQIWYKLHEFSAEPLSGRAILTMDFGSRVEAQLKDLAIKYQSRLENEGIRLELLPDEISFKICDITITGHVDGILIEGEEKYLWECKSITDQGFRMVQKFGPQDAHKRQATAYMKALGLKKTVFTYYNRNLAQPLDLIYDFDNSVWEEVEKRFETVILAKDSIPAREKQPNDKNKLPWECCYCAFVNSCWPEVEIGFSKGNKPILTCKEGTNESDTKIANG